jgi:catechol 2,3-dioxygenase-like lactoylglutathione lyase family enzyme
VTDLGELKVVFVAGFGPIVTEPQASQALYVGALGLPLESRPDDPDYFHGESLDGVRHFALWPLKGAARSCFGAEVWPDDVARPQAWIEFDVEDVRAASAVLKRRGYTLLVDTREEPWGQTVTRLLSPEGLLVGLTYTPWMRQTAR